MKNKKNTLLGVVAWSVGDNSFGCTKAYLEWANRFGNVKLIMPWELEPQKELDVVILPGGLDTNPSVYKAIPGYKTSNQDVYKEHFVNNCLKNYIDAGIGVFGICLGAQQLAAYFGLDLAQDLHYHPTTSSENRHVAAHRSRLLSHKFIEQGEIANDKGFGGMFKGKEVLLQNSLHHQSILIPEGMLLPSGKLNPEYKGDIIADTVFDPGYEDNIESFYHKNLPVFAYQGHCEEDYNEYCDNAMNWLLNYKDQEVTTELTAEVK